MKKLLLLFCLISFTGFAQTDECSEFASEFVARAKAKNFTDAYSLWAVDGTKCLHKGAPVYLAAEDMFRFLLANSSGEKREAIADELIAFYVQYDKAVASNQFANKVRQAMVLKEYFADKTDRRYELLDAAFKTDLLNFSDPVAIYDYFDLFYKKFTATGSKITPDEFLDRFDAVSARLATLSELSDGKSAGTAARGIKALAAKKINCEMLTPYYAKRFELNKDNSGWLKHATNMMLDENCTTAPEFRQITNKWYALSPSSESAYAAAVAAQRSGDKIQAMLLYNAAATLETVPRKKAELYYILASNSGSKREDAVNYAKKALEADSTFGKAYFLMAQMYASAGSDCATTPFEKKALNILAARTAAKAAIASPSLKAAAAAQSDAFMKRAPTKDEIKAERKSGQKITFSCWINESVTIQ